MKGMINWYWIVEEKGFAVLYNQKESRLMGTQAVFSQELDREGRETAEKVLQSRLRQHGGEPVLVDAPARVTENARKARVEVPAAVWQVVSEK